MGIADDNGVTQREHLIQAQAWSEIEGPAFPDLLAHVWDAFIELHNARPSGGFGPGPITHEGILAWMRVTGGRLAPWEVEAVKRVDATWMRVQGEVRSKQRSAGQAAPRR